MTGDARDPSTGWIDVVGRGTFGWAAMDVYESLIGLVMGGLGVALAILGVGTAFGLLPEDWRLRDKYPWYGMLGLSALAVLLGWIGLKSSITAAIDLMTPAKTFEGMVTGIDRQHRRGTRGGFYVWVVSSDTHAWEIPTTDASTTFKADVAVGQRMKITYRRGTGLVTHLSVRSLSGPV